MQIIRLELKKIRLWKYLLGLIITLAGILILTISPMLIPDGEDMMYHMPSEFLEASAVFLRVTFTIFIGIMIANLIVKEYENGTILNLFLYPIPKKKILISKLILIVSLGFVLMFAAHLLVGGFLSYYNNLEQLLPGVITMRQFSQFIFSSFFLMISTIATSMVALFVGLRMKSSVATIVSSIVIALVLNGNLGSADKFSSNMLVMTSFSLIGCLIVYFSVRNVEKQDI